MKSQKTTLISLAFIFGFTALYVGLGFFIWRWGFVPLDRSVMDTLVMIVFLLFAVLLPLGLLSAFSFGRAARKQAAENNLQKAVALRRRATGTLLSNIVEFAVGVLGYYLVSRQVFPQIESIWIFLVLISISTSVRIWFTRTTARAGNQSISHN
jgi:hypothetical protein